MKGSVTTNTTIELRKDQSAVVFNNDGEEMTVYIPDADNRESTMELSVVVLLSLASQRTPALAALFDAAYTLVADEAEQMEKAKAKKDDARPR